MALHFTNICDRTPERAYEQDGQQWVKHMQVLLINDILSDVKRQGGSLSAEQAKCYTERYRDLLKRAEIECPPPDQKRNPKQRGRT
ncbi:MAG: hypothetical protein NMNS02_29780 [Nitrosomonas sp.]|nr:MAG: hypothetical protein NMNS02_29780 [Nitrosomonas sp.]